ncbi:MAG TPA: acyl-CoA dehydrogenase family protein [Stellaceae bacterium]|jgi:3-hydroxy-9,10-secoandrosta-1,3,5(10)-triene-9,17-dione monooxygenase|nr:acyl-CoA dehydrogenase family protein [Stellaceae bacterium]
MTELCRTRSLSGEDDALPEAERAVLDRARTLIPRLAERAPAATAARRLPTETIAEYHESGILRILQPRRFGGLQGRFSLFSRIVEEFTFGCASSAWVYAVLAEHQWIIASYPEQAQIDVWGDDPEAVASSSLAPRAAARRVAGGWRLSGRYPFSSGCDYAQWGIVGAFLGEAGDPQHIAYLLVPLCEVEIVDDWHVLGLLGTGSKSLVLHDVFVPEHRCVMVSDLFAGTPPGALVHPEYPVLRAPRGFLVSYSLPPVCIALGRRALDAACRAQASRVSRGVTRVAESEVVQMAIGEAAAAIDVATLLLHHGREASTAAVSSGRKITEAEALRARRDMTFAQHQVGWALERLCELSGARWVYDTDPLQEIRRDVMTILTHHAASRQAAMVPYGHMLLERDAADKAR